MIASAPRPDPAPAAAPRERMLHVVQGEYAVVSEPGVVLTTILGSCVATCLWDPVAGVGGMNHFLLPGDADSGSDSMKYGVNAMELLVNGLLQRGALRSKIQGKVFGGARVIRNLSDVGAKNAAFALEFLRLEGIPCIANSLGGGSGASRPLLAYDRSRWPNAAGSRAGHSQRRAVAPARAAAKQRRRLHRVVLVGAMTSPAPRARHDLEAEQTPTGDVFLMLAEELERTRALGLRIEGAICGIAIRSSIDDALVSELQHLDAVLQHIAALRDYMAELSKQCEPHQRVETSSALDRITLAEVRARLAGGYCRDDPNDNWEML